MITYLKLKNGDIVCQYGYNGTSYSVYSLGDRYKPYEERKYFHICLSEIVQVDTNISVLGGEL